jgi:FixJ family two-component response regulator
MLATPLKTSAAIEVDSPEAEDEAGPTVFIVDDDISVRESLEHLIAAAGWRPESFASAQAFLARERAAGPSCLVLDVNLPDLNGLDLQEQVGADQIDMPIIFVTGYGDVPMSVRAMKAGAIEFLTKPIDKSALLAAVRDAIDRSQAVAGQAEDDRGLRARYAKLTPRERQIVAMVVSGMLNKQVAADLGISEITVKAHRGRMVRKMKARSFADLVKMGERLGIGTAQND